MKSIRSTKKVIKEIMCTVFEVYPSSKRHQSDMGRLVAKGRNNNKYVSAASPMASTNQLVFDYCGPFTRYMQRE